MRSPFVVATRTSFATFATRTSCYFGLRARYTILHFT